MLILPFSIAVAGVSLLHGPLRDARLASERLRLLSASKMLTESELLVFLASDAPEVRLVIVERLGEVGGAESVAKLREAISAHGLDVGFDLAARRAIRAIKARHPMQESGALSLAEAAEGGGGELSVAPGGGGLSTTEASAAAGLGRGVGTQAGQLPGGDPPPSSVSAFRSDRFRQCAERIRRLQTRRRSARHWSRDHRTYAIGQLVLCIGTIGWTSTRGPDPEQVEARDRDIYELTMRDVCSGLPLDALAEGLEVEPGTYVHALMRHGDSVSDPEVTLPDGNMVPEYETLPEFVVCAGTGEMRLRECRGEWVTGIWHTVELRQTTTGRLISHRDERPDRSEVRCDEMRPGEIPALDRTIPRDELNDWAESELEGQQ